VTVTMVVPTLYRKTQLADEILGKLGQKFPEQLAKTTLGFSVNIDEAQSHGQTIWEYAPRSSGAKTLEKIAEELVARAPARIAEVIELRSKTA
jgi:chromosome partitioning protein